MVGNQNVFFLRNFHDLREGVWPIVHLLLKPRKVCERKEGKSLPEGDGTYRCWGRREMLGNNRGLPHGYSIGPGPGRLRPRVVISELGAEREV